MLLDDLALLEHDMQKMLLEHARPGCTFACMQILLETQLYDFLMDT